MPPAVGCVAYGIRTVSFAGGDISVPLVPTIEISDVPGCVPAATVTVSDDCMPTVTVAGPNDSVTPAGTPDAASITGAVTWPPRVTVIPAPLVPPGATVMLAGVRLTPMVPVCGGDIVTAGPSLLQPLVMPRTSPTTAIARGSAQPFLRGVRSFRLAVVDMAARVGNLAGLDCDE